MTLNRIKLIITLFTISTLFLVGCKQSSKPKADPSIAPKFIESAPKFIKQGELFFFDKNNDTLAIIDIELADSPAKREKGLMHRKSMGENKGMLFIFDNEERQSFWMRNTHIALDLVFVNADKEIVHIAPDNAPYSLKQINSFEYALYVVEVNAGFCNKYKIKTGHKIFFQR